MHEVFEDIDLRPNDDQSKKKENVKIRKSSKEMLKEFHAELLNARQSQIDIKRRNRDE